MVDYSMSILTVSELEWLIATRLRKFEKGAEEGLVVGWLALEITQLRTALADQLDREEFERYGGAGAYLNGKWFGGWQLMGDVAHDRYRKD